MSFNKYEINSNSPNDTLSLNYLSLPVPCETLPNRSPLSVSPSPNSNSNTTLPSIKEILSQPYQQPISRQRRGSVSDYYLSKPISLTKSSPVSPKMLGTSYVASHDLFHLKHDNLNENKEPKYQPQQIPVKPRNRSFSVVESNMYSRPSSSYFNINGYHPSLYTNQRDGKISQAALQASLLSQRYKEVLENNPSKPYSLEHNDRFNCQECKASFSRKNSLKRHLFTHTTQRPYACKACDKSFYRADIYNRHLKSKRCQRTREITSLLVNNDSHMISASTIIEE